MEGWLEDDKNFSLKHEDFFFLQSKYEFCFARLAEALFANTLGDFRSTAGISEINDKWKSKMTVRAKSLSCLAGFKNICQLGQSEKAY